MAGEVRPQGFFAYNEARFTKSYLLKICRACRTAVEYMNSTQNSEHIITQSDRTASLDMVQVIMARYKKGLRREIVSQRDKMAKENVTLSTIKALLESKYITESIQSACLSLDDELHRPTTMRDLTNMRNVLISVLQIISIKRLQEFSEFRLCEYIEREKRTKPLSDEVDCYVIKISRHKTADFGPSLLFLSETEEKALTAYVKHYRIIATDCRKPDCLVFPN